MKQYLFLVTIVAICFFSTTAVSQRIVGQPVVPPITDGTIQAAVNALVATGGTIDIDPTYNPALEAFPVCINTGGPLLIKARFPGTPVMILGNGVNKIFAIVQPSVTIQELDFANAGPNDPSACATTAGDAGAIYCSGPNLVVQNCTFSNSINPMVFHGAGIFLDQIISATITDCQFTNNICGTSGGGAYVTGCTDVQITFCDFQANQAVALDGGGVGWWNDSNGLIADCTFAGNWTLYGGGISIVGCNTLPLLTQVDHNRIFSNVASGTLPCPFSGGHGGGIYIENSDDSVQVLNQNEIHGNTAEYYGGGIATVASFGTPCYPDILDNYIHDNIVMATCALIANGGGGISVFEDGAGPYSNHPLIQGNHVAGNEAGVGIGSVYGGGVGVFYASAQIDSNTVEDNVVEDSGGGIAAVASYLPIMGSAQSINDNLIQGNQARSLGGGISLDTCGPITLDRNRVDLNSATDAAGSWGGGLYVWSSILTARSNSFTQNIVAATIGHAIGLDLFSQMSLLNNTISVASPPAGDVVALGSPAILANNIISDYPNAIAVREHFADQVVSCTNNLFYNNNGIYDDWTLGSLDHTGLNAIPGNAGNIVGDPMLDGTYHISSDLSAAYQAGTDLTALGVTFDIDGEARPQELSFEIGSDEAILPSGIYDWQSY